MATIETLLIANRGEIAVRIARTARRLGMATIGVYSEPDRNALHCDAVDRAIALGGASPAESYLRGDAIIEAALATRADAVHPGYGFLAENADFARAVIDAGLIWVGPTPEQIRLLGDKIAAKRVAIDAGVPTTPIVEVAANSDPGADTEGEPFRDLSYPALVKAAAGGGGRGMRVVRSAADLAEAIASASREARSAFGDGTVFVEPFIERGRHIEVQILGDTAGNVVHLGDRECSVQRRNQKLIEEAPAPRLDGETRAALHEGAVALARHVGYLGAGTVEFMIGGPEPAAADGDKQSGGAKPAITFLEVNTRLQVEHPVTEAVTGLDLVELQLRIAEGRPLPFTQSDVMLVGHAIEVRVVAEDPADGWLPSTGRLTDFRIGATDRPAERESIRVDAGVREGSVISSDYDSLLAKVICHDDERETAARRLAATLRAARIAGVRTNASTLAAIMVEPDFLAASTPTAYLDDHPTVTRSPSLPGEERDAHFIAAVLAIELGHRRDDRVTGFAPSGWRNLRTRGVRRVLLLDDLAIDLADDQANGVSTPTAARGAEFHAEYAVEQFRDGLEVEVLLGKWPEADVNGALEPDERNRSRVRILERTSDRQVLEIDGLRRAIDVRVHDQMISTASAAGGASWHVQPVFDQHDSIDVGSGPVSPLPGTVISVHVEAGRVVAEGELLMVVEAMKMEHRIVATAASRVTEVRFVVGERVDTGDLLVALEATAGRDETDETNETHETEATADG